MDQPSSPTRAMSTSKPPSLSKRSRACKKQTDQSNVLEELLKVVQEGSHDHAHLGTQHLQVLTSSHDVNPSPVQDVAEHWDTILDQGQELMASAESKYQVEREEQVLEHLAMTAKAGAAIEGQDFCARRLEVQRQLLAKRLGLSSVMTRYTASVGETFQQNLMVQGLEAMEKPDVIINTEEDSWPKEERPQKKKTMKPNL
jgi:hypothetical protein